MPEQKLRAKNRQWLDHAAALQELARMKPKTGAWSWRVRRVMSAVIPMSEELAEERQDIMDLYFKKDAEGNVLQANGQPLFTDADECRARLKSLMNADTEVLVDPISKAELDAEGIVLTGEVAFLLGPLLVEAKMTSDGVEEMALAPVPE